MLNLTTTYKLIICLLLIFSTKSIGSQLSFVKQQNQEEIKFQYRWLDHLTNEQSLQFNVNFKQVFDKYRNFTTYKPNLALEHVTNRLRRHFRQQPIPGVLLQFVRQGTEIDVKIKSTSNSKATEASIQVSELQNKYFADYLEKTYYQEFITPDGVVAIKPDHRRIALESVEDFKALKPMIMAKSSIKNIRRVTNFVLGFIQSIPYSTLESRVNSSGAGFNPPLKLLWENQGDCDSKVTLAAAMLRMLMPRIKMALIFIDNHALIGIEDMPQDNDKTLKAEGVTYVLAEPTGPAMLPLGSIAPESERAIANRRYIIELFHSNESDDNEQF